MRAFSFLAFAASLVASAASAQSSSGKYDFRAAPNVVFAPADGAVPGRAGPRKPARVASAPAVDPYEKVRRAQTDYFRRQAGEQEKAKEKNAREEGFYKPGRSGRGRGGGGGNGFNVPLTSF